MDMWSYFEYGAWGLSALLGLHMLVDWLKTKAPFWKLEDTPKGEQWVGAHQEDDAAAARWEKK